MAVCSRGFTCQGKNSVCLVVDDHHRRCEKRVWRWDLREKAVSPYFALQYAYIRAAQLIFTSASVQYLDNRAYSAYTHTHSACK
jgi:hypothetical protein